MGKICVFSWLLSLSYDNCVSPHSHIGGKFGKLSIPHTFECQDIFLHETRLKTHFRSKTAIKTFPRHYLKILSFQKRENRTFSALHSVENHPKCRIRIIEFWHFPPIFVPLKLTCLVTLFDRKLQVFKNSPKWVIFVLFN